MVASSSHSESQHAYGILKVGYRVLSVTARSRSKGFGSCCFFCQGPVSKQPSEGLIWLLTTDVQVPSKRECPSEESCSIDGGSILQLFRGDSPPRVGETPQQGGSGHIPGYPISDRVSQCPQPTAISRMIPRKWMVLSITS